jgi:hypothetical protein
VLIVLHRDKIIGVGRKMSFFLNSLAVGPTLGCRSLNLKTITLQTQSTVRRIRTNLSTCKKETSANRKLRSMVVYIGTFVLIVFKTDDADVRWKLTSIEVAMLGDNETNLNIVVTLLMFDKFLKLISVW